MMMMMTVMYMPCLELCVIYFASCLLYPKSSSTRVVRTKTNIRAMLCILFEVIATLWWALEFSGVEGCVFHFTHPGPLSEYPWTITRYPPRNCLSYKPQFVAFEKFCALWQWKSRFIQRFFCYFGLISANVEKPLNIYDAVRRHCIPKPFVHTVLMLDVSANDMNDTTQGTSLASRANNQMVRG